MLYTIGSQTGVRVPPGVREVVQGVRGENISPITENGRNSRNVPFETELQLSDGNIFLCIQIPYILGCKAVFLSNKHNNDCNDEQTLIKEQNHEENVTSALNSATATPPFSTVDPHTSAKATFGHIHSLVFPIAFKTKNV